VIHTVGAGTDAGEPWLVALLIATGTPILYLGVMRALPPERPAAPRAAAATPANVKGSM
jgi:hypothetical protein